MFAIISWSHYPQRIVKKTNLNYNCATTNEIALLPQTFKVSHWLIKPFRGFCLPLRENSWSSGWLPGFWSWCDKLEASSYGISWDICCSTLDTRFTFCRVCLRRYQQVRQKIWPSTTSDTSIAIRIWPSTTVFEFNKTWKSPTVISFYNLKLRFAWTLSVYTSYTASKSWSRRGVFWGNDSIVMNIAS